MEAARFCSICFNVSEDDQCRICRDPRRDQTVLCVVEEYKDVVAIERTREFHRVHKSEGLNGAARMGARHGAWCLGCCWALMASLFALGVMSVVWMAVVAGLIAFEKLVPSRRVATYGTAALLLALGMLMLVAPDVVPGLTIPKADMTQMSP